MAAYSDAGTDIWDNVGAEVIFSTSDHALGARISERMRSDWPPHDALPALFLVRRDLVMLRHRT